MMQNVWAVSPALGEEEVTILGATLADVAAWYDLNLKAALGEIDKIELLVRVDHIAC